MRRQRVDGPVWCHRLGALDRSVPDPGPATLAWTDCWAAMRRQFLQLGCDACDAEFPADGGECRSAV
jgi:hypothetical protein